MIESLARLLIVLFGAALVALALYGFVKPGWLLSWIKRLFTTVYAIPLTAGTRLLMGAVLLLAAPAARFPVTFEVIGWIAIVAAVVIVLVGRDSLSRWIDWWLSVFTPAITRIWLLLALVFGCFLIFAVV